jgi:phytoene synthase
MRECGIEPGIVRELIAGMASDAETVRVADEAELLRYCYRAAGTVGLMMCRVLDAPEPAAAAHAVDLGIAMQLTNLCRDVSADARMGRRYLPASLVGDIGPTELIDPSPTLQPALRAAVARLLALAETYYASGEAGLPFLPVRALAPASWSPAASIAQSAIAWPRRSTRIGRAGRSYPTGVRRRSPSRP